MNNWSSGWYVVNYNQTGVFLLRNNLGMVATAHKDALIKDCINGEIPIGVELVKGGNPMFMISSELVPGYGLNVEIFRPYVHREGNFIAVLLLPGDVYGRSLSSVIKEPTVQFYYIKGTPTKEHPYGKFVTSYFLDTLIGHYDGLCLDADVSAWTIPSSGMLQFSRLFQYWKESYEVAQHGFHN